MPPPDPDLLNHLDNALEALLAARLRAGIELHYSLPTEVLEAGASRDDNYRQARQDAADALGLVLAAVEHDPQLRQLVMELESAYLRFVAAGMDLGWRAGTTARSRAPGAS